jgi:hypothetical protein
MLDGRPMEEEAARAFWSRFSRWMEERKGDLAGFAAEEGLASVHPEMHEGRAVLVASRTAPQRPYANAPNVDRSRSVGPSGIQRDRPSPARKHRKSR